MNEPDVWLLGLSIPFQLATAGLLVALIPVTRWRTSATVLGVAVGVSLVWCGVTLLGYSANGGSQRPGAGGEIVILAVSALAALGLAALSVSDTGHGISPATLAH